MLKDNKKCFYALVDDLNLRCKQFEQYKYNNINSLIIYVVFFLALLSHIPNNRIPVFFQLSGLEVNLYIDAV